jgi:hypothetical protein
MLDIVLKICYTIYVLSFTNKMDLKKRSNMNKNIENLKDLNEILRTIIGDLEKNADGEEDFYDIINGVFDSYYYTNKRLQLITVLQDFLSDDNHKKLDNILGELLETYVNEVIL